ncbi:MAG: VWA domain-containing protein [Bacteroidota bacterium]
MFPFERIEQELSSFIELGGVMTKAHRKELVHLLYKHFYDPGFNGPSALANSDLLRSYPNWSQLVSKIMEEEELKELSFHNDDFSLSVTKEAVSWIRTTYDKFLQDYSYRNEEKEIGKFQQHLTDASSEDWVLALDSLKDQYPEHQQSWDFYARQIQSFQEQVGNSEDLSYSMDAQDRLKVLYQRIVADWKRQLQEKRTQNEQNFLHGEFGSYFQGLKQKIHSLNQVGDIVAPFFNFLGQVWTNSLDNWESINWDKLTETAKSLQKDPNLQQLAELLGRLHTSQIEKVWEKMEKTVDIPIYKPNSSGKSEIVGVHHSDLISALLPSEVALLSTPETEIIFSKKYVEKKLLTFQYRSWDKLAQPSQKQVEYVQVDSEEQGPIILCIDTSGSMYGDPERIAKALAFGIIEIALREKRKAYLISFSAGIATLEASDIDKDLDKMLSFLQMSFHGSTNLQPALEEALQTLEKKSFSQADVLVISDFVIPSMNRNISDRVLAHRQDKGTHFHSLHIRNRPDSRTASMPIFDHHWVYDMSDPKILRKTIDHFEQLRGKNEKIDKLQEH